MGFEKKLLIILLAPVMAAVALWYGRGLPLGVPSELESAVQSARNMLVFVVLLYAANFAIAWRYRQSWPIFLARALFFGVLAFVCIDKLVYLWGEGDGVLFTALGEGRDSDRPELFAMGLQFYYWALGLVHSAIAIAVGFETIHPEGTAPHPD